MVGKIKSSIKPNHGYSSSMYYRPTATLNNLKDILGHTGPSLQIRVLCGIVDIACSKCDPFKCVPITEIFLSNDLQHIPSIITPVATFLVRPFPSTRLAFCLGGGRSLLTSDISKHSQGAGSIAPLAASNSCNAAVCPNCKKHCLTAFDY